MSFFVERTEPLPCKSNNRVNIPCHQVSREFPIRIKCDCELHFFSRPEYAIQLSHPLAIASSPICWAILPVDPVIPVLIWRRTGLFLFFMRPSGGLSYNQILPPPSGYLEMLQPTDSASQHISWRYDRHHIYLQ